MKIYDILDETFSALLSNKVRSGLTVLGIVIGISSVISMLAIGNGSQASIESSIQSIGSNLLIVSPGSQRRIGGDISAGRGSAKTLILADATAVSDSVSNIKAVAADVSGRYQVTAKGTNTNTQVVGTVAEYSEVKNVSINLGRFIGEQDVKNNSKVAVLGSSVSEDLFASSSNPVGQIIRINKIEFKVVGVTTAKGGNGMNSQDNMIYIPISTAQKFMTGSNYLSTINISVNDSENMTTAQNDITELLLSRHKISDPTKADFSIMNQTDILSSASSITGTFTALLGAIAGISLVVGGIGIMNMMLMTVTERTREIGLRKAIGAKRRDVSTQFLVEAIILTMFSGVIGILLGWFISWIVSTFASIETAVTLSSVLLAFGTSTIIGIIFGYYPARRASALNPIEALRYE